jgi:hypothetical protein
MIFVTLNGVFLKREENLGGREKLRKTCATFYEHFRRFHYFNTEIYCIYRNKRG